jgi:GNAT superfamily N-acetyltransferase
MTVISLMTDADLEFATELATGEEWGYLEEDFRRLVLFEPEGCFVAWHRGERVGIVTTTSYEDYGFLGSMIVRKGARGKGIGESLLSHAITYLRGRGVKTVELDGVFSAVSLYRRLGFTDKYLSLRFKGLGCAVEDRASPFRPEQAERVVVFDRAGTGISRERVIGLLLAEFPDSVYVVGGDSIAGYAMVRPREGAYFAIGPLVAEDAGVAELLLRSIMANQKDEVLTIGVPAVNRDAVSMLLRNRFTYAEPSLRMYLGQRRDYESKVFGILAAEKG